MKMKMFKKSCSVFRITSLLVVVILLFTSMFTVSAAEDKEQEDPNIRYIQSLKGFILHYYKMDITESELLEGALKNILKEHPELVNNAVEGMLNSLDEYSTYFDEEEYKQFATDIDGRFGGIGISVEKKGEYITVVSPLDDTPAQRAGLKSGDKIIFVDDTDVTNKETDVVVPIMRGEPGTSVRLGIKREGVDGILYFDIVREIIKVNPISFKVLEDEIGYIKIQTFNSNTEEYLRKALDEFDSKGITKLIIDVRYNPGGSLEQVVDVAKHFVPNKGPIVHIDYKKPEDKQTYYSDIEDSKYQLVVLVNEWSASASEIFAGAIQDSKAGTIIGVKTFGKGTVQQLIPLKKGGAMKLTMAKYLTPSGVAIDGVGIKPDIVVKNEKQKIDVNTLEKLEITRRMELGDTGKDVLAAEQRLKILGYKTEEPDEMLDEETYLVVKNFQSDRGLFPYGVLDITTQIYLENAISDVEIEVDKQLEEAIKVLKAS